LLSLYKKAFSGLSTSTWWLSVILLINRSGNMVTPFLTIYLTQRLHLSISQAGLVLAIWGAGSVLGALLGGRLSDRIGFYPVQFWSLLLNGMMFIVLGQMRTMLQVSICVFILALVGDAFRPANATAIAYYSKPENRTRSYSLHRLAVNLGFSIGPALGGMLAAISYSFLFWADGLTCILAALIMRLVLPPAKTVKPAAAGSAPAVKGPPAYKDGGYLFFVVLVCMYAMFFFQLSALVSVYFKTVIKMPELYIGMTIGLNGLLIALLEMVFVYKLEGKRAPLDFIWRGVLINGLAYLSFNLLPPTVAVAVLFILLFTLSEMLSVPFMNAFWTSRSGEHNRGQYAALYTIAFSVAQIISPTMSTYIVQHLGFADWWYTVAGGSLVTAAGFWYLHKRTSAAHS
jgi:predicted MFS family arabinose efflux permease